MSGRAKASPGGQVLVSRAGLILSQNYNCPVLIRKCFNFCIRYKFTHHLFPDAPPPLPPPTRPHLLQAKAAKERADAAAVEKEAAEKAAAEAIVYIKCPYCRQICYIF